MLALPTRRVVQFLKREDGPTAVEYAVMLALIIMACVATISTLGLTAKQKFATPPLKNALT